jgi:deoxyribodipyrimidine photo-lyase
MPDTVQQDSRCRLGTDYPRPVVDHSEAVRHARRCFSELRDRDDYWQAAREVMRRHGSRKNREKRPARSRKKPGVQPELPLRD